MEGNSTRRRFVTGAALAGGAITTFGAFARRASAQPKRATTELIRVGVVGVGEYSHMPTIWGPTINPVPEVWPVRTTRMVMTHVWDSRRKRRRSSPASSTAPW